MKYEIEMVCPVCNCALQDHTHGYSCSNCERSFVHANVIEDTENGKLYHVKIKSTMK